MNEILTEEFFNSNIKFHSTNANKNKNNFIPNKLPIKNPVFPYIHVCAEIEMNASSSSTISPIPYILLLHTKSGSARITIDSQEYELKKNTLAIIPLDFTVIFQSVKTPYIQDAFFLSGDILRCLLSRVTVGADFIVRQDCSNYLELTISNMKQTFIDAPDNSDIITFKYFTDIIAELAFYKQIQQDDYKNVELPKHVKTLKLILESEYSDLHTLESLEERIGVNKYRLCHDFSKAMNISPIQYLNKMRIEKSKTLLEDTTLTIHEIGESVGIENPTHYINLFKKNCGMTPLQYRTTRTHAFINADKY